MSFPELRGALVDGVFAAFGEDALWDGIADPVRVRVREYDDSDRFEGLSVIARARVARVRKAQVPTPREDDEFGMIDASGEPTGERWRVAGEPMLSRNGVWAMPVRPLAS